MTAVKLTELVCASLFAFVHPCRCAADVKQRMTCGEFDVGDVGGFEVRESVRRGSNAESVEKAAFGGKSAAPAERMLDESDGCFAVEPKKLWQKWW